MASTELLDSAGRSGRGLVVLSALILGASAPSSAWAAPSSSVEVLESFGVGARGLDVVVDRCHTQAASNDLAMAECPMRIRLLDGAKVVDTATFGAKACGAPSRDGEARRLGVPSGVQIWWTSSPVCAVSVAVESVRVAPEETGVLVSASRGHQARRPQALALRRERGKGLPRVVLRSGRGSRIRTSPSSRCPPPSNGSMTSS